MALKQAADVTKAIPRDACDDVEAVNESKDYLTEPCVIARPECLAPRARHAE
jgi:hypothetical protein